MEEPQYIKLKMTFYELDLHGHAMLLSLFKNIDPSIKKSMNFYIAKKELELTGSMID